MKLIKNPETQIVYLDDGNTLMGFDGSPYARPANADAWKVVSRHDVPNGEEWLRQPGWYGTNHAVAAIAVQGGKDDQPTNQFTAGGPTNFINNWVRDCRDDGKTVSLQWLAAYDDRNAARAAAQVEW